ncbi:MAG TPA: DUF2625 domain-containing protein [Paenibacillus sp.]|uniref:DUF2625 domain-containing protein n=1 Tax=Paenibacillus TaxID=44249 RepID=UPI000B9FAF36|nr:MULTISPECIES: DUF2625 domain-containing protein [Paenibacillus]OZQ72637.1 sugar phosphate permease [Paenibacillus taichungensis]HBU83496.1 DUF2625 domain-containing protein [Paenibacillus sp.]
MHKLTANELVDRENHAWEELKELLDHGQNKYTYVPAQREVGEDALYRLQVSTKSYLGAVAYETTGIVLDDGWITLLGSGGDQTFGSLTSWNGVADKPCVPALEGMMVVAYDAAGGFFGMDTGKYGCTGHVYYFAPDTLEWESTELAYSGFINWLANGDLEQYYQTFRWKGWQNDMVQLQIGQVFAYYPPLWTEEGSGESSSKAPVAVEEAWKAALAGK